MIECDGRERRREMEARVTACAMGRMEWPAITMGKIVRRAGLGRIHGVFWTC